MPIMDEKEEACDEHLISNISIYLRDMLEPGWRRELGGQFLLPYFQKLLAYLSAESRLYTVYPPPHHVFSAFSLCPFDNVRVVILGQDPYHGEGQAHGLAFSVPTGNAIPSSLRNIIRETKREPSGHGNLERWAAQGVLLLNTTLTVREGQANSHQRESGWGTFTDYVIRCVSDGKEGVVFLLWGRHAQKKALLIDRTGHCVLETSHPSGLSCYRGFRGSNCFEKANEYLKTTASGKPIDWSV